MIPNSLFIDIMTTHVDDSITLYLVASPIGNLEDITRRAIAVLKQVDWIACEDTRRARTLLKRYEIDTPMELYHDRNQARKTPKLVKLLSAGRSGALLTDAGSPGISDPGFTLVRATVAAGFRVVPVPGPSAVIAALTASGLPCDRFVFEGYLPRTGAKRRRRLSTLKNEERTIVFYVSPHRLPQEMREMALNLGDRPACLAREMTKIYEEFRRGSLGELADLMQGKKIRGEFTLVVAGTKKKP